MSKTKTKKIISKDDNIASIVEEHPEMIGIFMQYGLHCIGCHLSMFETIEEGALAHGLTNREIKKMIDEINLKLEK